MRKVSISYAKALLNLAVTRKALREVHEDMRCLQDVCATNKRFVAALKNPTIQREQQWAIIKQVFHNSGHVLTLRFFERVVQHRRVPLLPEMNQAFMAQHDQYQGIKRGRVIAASPLPNKLIQSLQQVAQIMAPCRQVLLAQSIDPTLIGGYILYVADKRLDQSLRKKLQTLQKHWVAKGY